MGVRLRATAVAVITLAACSSHHHSASTTTTGAPVATTAAATTTTATTAVATSTTSTTIVPGAPLDPVSLTFGSLDDGWLLAAPHCGAGDACTLVLERTTDGGAHWQRVGAPAASASTVPDVKGAVSGVRFADPSNGWLFGDGVWSTHDGGAHWTHTALATVQSMGVASDHSVYAAVARTSDNGGVTVDASPVTRDAWHQVAPTLQFGAGPVLDVSFVVSGTRGWLAYNDRGLNGALRMTNGAWGSWPAHCGGDDTLALATPNVTNATLYVTCNAYGIVGPPWRSFVARSTDGGTSFTPVLVRTSSTNRVPRAPVVVASPVPSTVVALDAPNLVASFDGGTSFTTVAAGIGNEVVDGGFTTTTRGFVIVRRVTDGSTALWLTRDGGHTWSHATV